MDFVIELYFFRTRANAEGCSLGRYVSASLFYWDNIDNERIEKADRAIKIHPHFYVRESK